MDLICLILSVIDFFKPSFRLSVAILIIGCIEIYMLICHKREFNVSYFVTLLSLVWATYVICVI